MTSNLLDNSNKRKRKFNLLEVVMKNGIAFEEYLRKENLSKNTLASYLWTAKYFAEHYDCASKENLLAYKGYLLEYYKAKTVNLRIQGMNKYLCFIGKEKLQLKFVKLQQKDFLENVISNADYQFLKAKLKADGNLECYFVVWFIAATGARVSELVQIKVEHVKAGYFDLYRKGGKLRRLYISFTAFPLGFAVNAYVVAFFLLSLRMCR